MDALTADALTQRIRNERPAGIATGQHLALAIVVAAASLWLASPAAASAVYKWVDPQGHLHYSDRPPPPEGKLVSVDLTATVHSSLNNPPAPAAAPPGPRPGLNTPEQAACLKQAVDSDVDSKRSEECKAAKERYQKDVQSRRLYREGPDKERIYLTDAELETERVNARRELEDACRSSESP